MMERKGMLRQMYPSVCTITLSRRNRIQLPWRRSALASRARHAAAALCTRPVGKSAPPGVFRRANLFGMHERPISVSEGRGECRNGRRAMTVQDDDARDGVPLAGLGASIPTHLFLFTNVVLLYAHV